MNCELKHGNFRKLNISLDALYPLKRVGLVEFIGQMIKLRPTETDHYMSLKFYHPTRDAKVAQELLFILVLSVLLPFVFPYSLKKNKNGDGSNATGCCSTPQKEK